MPTLFTRFMAGSNGIVPHDILGAGAIAAVALWGLLSTSGSLFVAFLVILIIAVAVTVDLTAHGWDH